MARAKFSELAEEVRCTVAPANPDREKIDDLLRRTVLLKGQKLYILTGLLVAVWTAVIVVILDLSAPRLGTLRTDLSVYDWTLESFKGGLSVPPSILPN